MTTKKNSESIYNYIMKQQVPEQWSTPATLKASYQNTVGAANAYQPQINTALRQYGSFQPVTSTREYRNLLDMYNKEYQQRAALAAAETVKASQAANAGFGDTYSKAASNQAHSAYMADRGAAVPILQAAAADAYSANKSTIAAGIDAMNNQRDIRMRALQSLFGSQLSGIQKERTSQQEALNTRFNALTDAYTALYNYENQDGPKVSPPSISAPSISRSSSRTGTSKGSSGGSGGGGGGYRTSYYKQQQETQKTPKKNHQSMDGRRKDAWTIYDNAIKIYPGLKGKLQPPGHNRDSGSFMDGYANYVQKQIDNHKKNISARRKK